MAGEYDGLRIEIIWNFIFVRDGVGKGGRQGGMEWEKGGGKGRGRRRKGEVTRISISLFDLKDIYYLIEN